MKKIYMFPIKIVKVYDGDTIYADIDLGFNIWLNNQSIRLNGINTPEIRTKNKVEKMAGNIVTEFVKQIMPPGEEVMLISNDIENLEDNIKSGKFGRIIGDIILGKDVELANLLLEKQYAVSYCGGKRELFDEEFLINIINNRKII